VTTRKSLRCQRGIGEPSNVWRVASSVQAIGTYEAEVEEEGAKCGQPEAECVESREGHVPGSDHNGDQVIGESEHKRHGHKEDHRGAMHGEHLIEEVWRDEMITRGDKLNSHDGGFDATDHEEYKRKNDVHDAQPLVVNGGNPIVKPVHQGAVSWVGFWQFD
jgi:hypothetical protein